MDLINNVDLVSLFHRSEFDLFPKIADFVYPTIGRSVNLYNVHGAAFLNPDTRFTPATRIRCRARLTVQGLCQHLRDCSLACPSRATEKVCMGRAACCYSITQSARDMILSHDFGECLRSEAAIQRDICHLWFPLTPTYGLLAPPFNSCRGHCHGS